MNLIVPYDVPTQSRPDGPRPGRWAGKWSIVFGEGRTIVEMTDRSAAKRHPIIEHLAGLGPRPAGEAAETAAADYLAQEFQRLGLETWVQPFKFVGWQQTRPATVSLLAPERRDLAAGSMAYTDSTPAAGVTGRLVKVGIAHLCPGLFEWPKYAVIDDRGNEVASLLCRIGGGAIPMPNTYPTPIFMSTTVNIGEEDGNQIDQWLAGGEEVRVTVATAGHHVPGLVSHNVLARLPGRSDDEIVVSSHIDTAPGAPGAIDNASGTQVVFDIAERMAAAGTPEHTFTFAAFGAEEYSLLGSDWYVSERKTRGSLNLVKANLNFDTVGIGSTIFCLLGPDLPRDPVERLMKQLGADEHFPTVTYATTVRAVDAYPFHQEGIPNVTFVVWPYDAYHLPADNLALVDHEVVDRISRLGQEFAMMLDRGEPDSWLGKR